MKFPRTSITGLMTRVVFVAANCAMVKGVMTRRSIWSDLFILGFLPMANRVAIGLLPWLRHRPPRAGFIGFWARFVVCGGLASATFLILSLRFTDDLFQLPQTFFEPYIHLRPGLGLVSSARLIFVGPQLAFTGFGG